MSLLFYRTQRFGKLPKNFSEKIESFSSDFGPKKAQNRVEFKRTQEFQGFERMKFFFMEKEYTSADDCSQAVS